MPRILVVPGSLRAASSSRATAKALVQRLASHAEFTIHEVGGLPHYNADVTDNPEVAAFIEAVGGADGVLFVTPEYNYSVPGVLKNAIDWASRPAFASVFKDKPCFVITVSGGVTGGVRAQSHLKYILNGMLARVFPAREVLVAQANAKVTDGVLTDEGVLSFAEAEIIPFIESLA
ncbi:NAD(P)H-dependent oxidoreductase [Sulfitobacter sp. LCG007]